MLLGLMLRERLLALLFDHPWILGLLKLLAALLLLWLPVLGRVLLCWALGVLELLLLRVEGFRAFWSVQPLTLEAASRRRATDGTDCPEAASLLRIEGAYGIGFWRV